MNARTRRARRILRTARRGPWGKGRNALKNAMKPVYAEDGKIMHWELVDDPWYTRRRGDLYHPGLYYMQRSSLRTNGLWRPLGPKSRQKWLKEIEKGAIWDMEHALSDCCGWGKEEVYHETIEFTGSIIPARNRMPDFKEKE